MKLKTKKNNVRHIMTYSEFSMKEWKQLCEEAWAKEAKFSTSPKVGFCRQLLLQTILRGESD